MFLKPTTITTNKLKTVFFHLSNIIKLIKASDGITLSSLKLHMIVCDSS
jgi:hypothetical protein